MATQEIDLRSDVLPISKVASSIAARIKSGRVTVITQKGYPQAVLMPIEEYIALVEARESLVTVA